MTTPPPPPVCSLSPDDDPLCALLMIDFYAIRAEDYAFLRQLYLEWEVCLPMCPFGVGRAGSGISMHIHSMYCIAGTFCISKLKISQLKIGYFV